MSLLSLLPLGLVWLLSIVNHSVIGAALPVCYDYAIPTAFVNELNTTELLINLASNMFTSYYCNDNGGWDTVIAFRPTASGNFVIKTETNSGLDTVLFLLDGGKCFVKCNDNFGGNLTSTIYSYASANETLLLVVSTRGVPDAPVPRVKLSIEREESFRCFAIAAPTTYITEKNATRAKLSLEANTFTSYYCYDQEGQDTAVAFQPTKSGRYAVSTLPATTDTVLFLLDSRGCYKSCNDDFVGDPGSTVFAYFDANQTYILMVSSYGEPDASFGDVSLSIVLEDHFRCFDNVDPIAFINEVNGTGARLTLRSNTFSSPYCVDNHGVDSVVAFRPTTSGNYAISTLPRTTDAVLSLLDEKGCHIACNDDFDLFPERTGAFGSTIISHFKSDETVLVVVSAYGVSNRASISLEIVPEERFRCFDNIVPATFITEVNASAATLSLQQNTFSSYFCFDDSGWDLAVAFRPTISGIFEVSTSPEEQDTVLYVLNGNGCYKTCNDDFNGTRASTIFSYFNANETALLVVSTFGVPRSAVTVSLSTRLLSTRLDLLCSDACSDAQDGTCQDGGPGVSSFDCEYGTDCTDCGPRIPDVPSSGEGPLRYNLVAEMRNAGQIRSVASSPDDRFLAAGLGFGEYSVVLWDLIDHSVPKHVLHGHIGNVNEVAFSPASSDVLLSGSSDGTALLWVNISSSQPRISQQFGPFNNGRVTLGGVNSVAVSDSGKYVAIAVDSYFLVYEQDAENSEIWTRKVFCFFNNTDAEVTMIRFSRVDNTMLTVLSIGLIVIYDIGECENAVANYAIGRRNGRDEVSSSRSYSGVFHPTREYFAVSFERGAEVFDISNGFVATSTFGHGDVVNQVVFSPDGTQLVTGSKDFTAKVWTANGGELLATLSGHLSEVSSVLVTTKQSLVVTASFDGRLRVWAEPSCSQVDSNAFLGDDGICSCKPGYVKAKEIAKFAVCKPCPSGTYSDEGTECKPCPFGLVSQKEGNSQCGRCPLLFEAKSATECVPCLIGFFVPNDDVRCIPCRSDQVVIRVDNASTLGRPNLDPALGYTCGCDAMMFEGANGKCEPCPQGALCAKRIWIEDDSRVIYNKALLPLKGYWTLTTANQSNYSPCRVPEACLGVEIAPTQMSNSTEVLLASERYASQLQSADKSTSTCSACANGYVGILCLKCASGYYQGWRSTCNKCLPEQAIVACFAIGIVAITFSIAFVVYRIVRDYASAEEIDYLIVLLSTMQQTSMAMAISIPWATWVRNFYGVLEIVVSAGASAFSIDCLPSIFSPQQDPVTFEEVCGTINKDGSLGRVPNTTSFTSVIDPYQFQSFFVKASSVAALPIAAFIVSSAFWSLHYLFNKVKKRRGICPCTGVSQAEPQVESKTEEQRNRAPEMDEYHAHVVTMIVVLFWLYPILTQMALFFVTPTVEEYDGHRFLHSDPNVVWGGEAHVKWLALGICMLIFYSFGIPTFLFLRLQSEREKSFLHRYHIACWDARDRKGTNVAGDQHGKSCLPKFKRRFCKPRKSDQSRFNFLRVCFFLYRSFKERYPYWQVLMLYRKFALAIAVTTFAPLGAYIQCATGFAVLAISLVVQVGCAPYISRKMNTIESMGLMVNCITFYAGSLLVAEEFSEAGNSVVSVIAFLCNVFFMAYVLYLTFETLGKSRKGAVTDPKDPRYDAYAEQASYYSSPNLAKERRWVQLDYEEQEIPTGPKNPKPADEGVSSASVPNIPKIGNSMPRKRRLSSSELPDVDALVES